MIALWTRLTERFGRVIWALLALVFSLLTITVSAILDRTVEPIIPAQLFAGEAASSSQPATEARAVDFVFRPLFWASREPIESEQTDVVEKEPVIDVAADPEALEGFKLVGVFASGDIRGGILQSEDEERSRLYLGESIDGWQLTDVGERSVTFGSGSGASTVLELAVASGLPVPRGAVQADNDPRDQQGASSAQSAAAVKAPLSRVESDPMTFESVAERKRSQPRKRSDKESR